MFGCQCGMIERAIRAAVMGVLVCQLAGCGTDALSEVGAQRSSNLLDFSFRSIPDIRVDTNIAAESRHYLTGTVPVAISTNTFDQAQRVTARVVGATGFMDCFVARPRADWESFGPDGDRQIIPDLLAAVNIVRERGVECIVIEIDPVSDRRTVGRLPDELMGNNFSDIRVREPIKQMAIQIALDIQPTYLSIGVEMNGYFESEPVDYENYVMLHKQTYDAIKSVAPSVQVIGSFNLESMQGFFGELDEFSDHPPQWFLIDMLEPKLDAVAFSSLPFPLFIAPVLIPDDYLPRVELHTSRDILFTELGWPGDPESAAYTPESQAEYIAVMARQLSGMPQVKLAVWTSFYDPDLGSPDDLHPDFANLGLIRNDGEEKPGFDVWRQLHQLPYRP
jgi:hypothetical protein